MGSYTVGFTNGSAAVQLSSIVGSTATAAKVKIVLANTIGGSTTLGLTSDSKVVITLPGNNTFTGNINTNFLIFRTK